MINSTQNPGQRFETNRNKDYRISKRFSNMLKNESEEFQDHLNAAQDLIKNVTDELRQIVDGLETKFDDTLTWIRETTEEEIIPNTKRVIKEHPIATVLVGASIGFLVSLAVRAAIRNQQE